MSPPWCHKSDARHVDDEIDDEGVTTCPACQRTVLVVAGRIRKHRMPGRRKAVA